MTSDIRYCPHDRATWDQASDGGEFCPECGCGVCEWCGALFETNDAGDGYEAPCDCRFLSLEQLEARGTDA
jgi:hypothetical protein